MIFLSQRIIYLMNQLGFFKQTDGFILFDNLLAFNPVLEDDEFCDPWGKQHGKRCKCW